jgi:cysteine-rich repeat protein
VAPALADPAPISGTCAEGVELAHGCADDGEAFRGICFTYFEDQPMKCERACLTEASCAAGEFCALRFSSGLGVCLPDPVCGDGELGEIGEACDDGNTASGDGCSADCQTVEYGPLCAALPTLALETSVAGSTVHGVDGFMSTCQFGSSRAQLYTVDVPGPGRLTLTMTSPKDQSLSLRGSCGEGPDELACEEHANAGGTEVLVAQVTSAGPSSLVAMVSATTVLEHGDFTLAATFVAEQCGDGVVAGRELCDDGNTLGNDGCSADCRRVEYEVFCAQAPVLALGDTTGDTSSAVPLYDGSCESDFGTGVDRLYRFTAPSSGNLTVRLDQGAADLGLYVLSACDVPGVATELGCSSVRDVEEVVVPLAAAQTVTIVVDGFRAGQAGPYTLHTSFP